MKSAKLPTLHALKESVTRRGAMLSRIDRVSPVILDCETAADFADSLQAIGAAVTKRGWQFEADETLENALDESHKLLLLAGYGEVCSTLRDAMKACAADRSARKLLILLAIANEGIRQLDATQLTDHAGRLDKSAVKKARACFRQIRPRWIEAVSTMRADLIIDAQSMIDRAKAMQRYLMTA